MNNDHETPTVVLAHGAWTDGSSWKDVIRGLEREELRVVAAPIPLTSLGDDLDALKRPVARTEGPVILGATLMQELLLRWSTLSAAVQRPIAVKCIQEPVPKPAWRSKPCWFLIAEEDRMINPNTQHFMARRMGAKTRSFPVDHAPLLTAPQKVVDIIVEATIETKQAISACAECG